MISSMTGFGEAACHADGIAYTVEIKTVNNRYFKTNMKISEVAAFAAEDAEKILREQIRRGTVNYVLRMQSLGGQSFAQVDSAALAEYARKVQAAAESLALDNQQVDLAALLTLPGVVQPAVPDAELAEKMKKVILELTEQAIKQLKQMRACEGKALAKDLLANCRVIKEKLQLISQQAPNVVTLYYEKLQKRIAELLGQAKGQIDQDTLSRETAIFAERSDIAEELSRLHSHLAQFETCCAGNDHSGRRLDFISQEMLREANTIASKASNVEISRWIIDVKCAIDRIKEQVQNVE